MIAKESSEDQPQITPTRTIQHKLTLEDFRKHWVEDLNLDAEVESIVGYSGGADSTCLLHLLNRMGIKIVAAYLHHGQRIEADQELENCAEFCNRFNIPFASGRANVPELAQNAKIGIEEAGRIARYRFLREVASRFNYPYVMTAHTRSDQVETILLHLTRGSGLRGLAGIAPKEGDLIRPLLPFDRADIENYCKSQNLEFSNDSTNEEIKYARVRVRKQVIPNLVGINSNFFEAIERFAIIASEDNNYLNALAIHQIQHFEVPLNGKLQFLTKDAELSFETEALAQLPDPLLSRAIRLPSERLGASPTFDQLKSIAEAIRSHEKCSITFEGGIIEITVADKVHIRKIEPRIEFREVIPGPGELELAEFNWKLKIEAKTSDFEIATKQERASLNCQLDVESIQGQLYARSVHIGDRIQPLGFDHQRKVSDLLSEYKLTELAKNRIPIVCDFIGPVWIPGICLSNRFATKESTKSTLQLQLEST